MKGSANPQPAENTITSRDGNGRTRQESNDASKTKPSSEPAPAIVKRLRHKLAMVRLTYRFKS
jgi:hypothetical protein